MDNQNTSPNPALNPNPAERPAPTPNVVMPSNAEAASAPAPAAPEVAPAPAAPEAAPAAPGVAPLGFTAPAAPAPAPATAPMPTPTPAAPAPAPVPGTPAGDVDVIEPEWVNKAEGAIAAHQNDPYGEEEAVEKLQEEYLQQRYGIKVADPNTDNSKSNGS